MTATTIRTGAAGTVRGPSTARTLAGFARNPFAFLARCVERYGDVYRLPLGSGVLVVNDPDEVASWLTDYERFVKGEMSRAIEPALGYGIPVSDGEHWRQRRRAMNPMFGRRSLDGIATGIADSLQASMDRWASLADRGEPVDVYREIGILTQQALQRTLFSSSVPDDDVPELVDAFDDLRRWMGGLMITYWRPGFVPAPGERAGRAAKALISGRIHEAIRARRAAPIDSPDLLNLLLEARLEDGTPLSDADLHDELLGLWFGGYDTTGSALAWTLAMLAQNPEAAEALRAEADGYGGGFASMRELADLPYAKACFDEGQRFQGALLLTRDAVDDCEVAGVPVAKGAMVGVSAYTLNRHPGWWRDPLRYRPERFLGDEGAAQHKYQFVMFGGGPRHCIGSSLAYLEAQFVLTMIAQRFHVQPVPGWTPRHDFHLSIGLKGGLPATIRHRSTRW